jgi:hypothetical protein
MRMWFALGERYRARLHARGRICALTLAVGWEYALEPIAPAGLRPHLVPGRKIIRFNGDMPDGELRGHVAHLLAGEHLRRDGIRQSGLVTLHVARGLILDRVEFRNTYYAARGDPTLLRREYGALLPALWLDLAIAERVEDASPRWLRKMQAERTLDEAYASGKVVPIDGRRRE